MTVEAPRLTTTEPSPATSPDAGVIEEARSRQRRHRRVGACVVLAVASAVVIGFVSGGGGKGNAPGGAAVANGGAAVVRGFTLRLPRGRSTTTFTVIAPARRAYDVTVVAPAASAIVLTMKISPGVGWTVNTLDSSECHTVAGHTDCLLHFAEGGNPGGKWTGILHKSAVPAARVHVSIEFARHGREFPG